MTESPILFSAPMVRALRENRKTQTRRTRGLNVINAEPDAWKLQDQTEGGFFRFTDGKNAHTVRCPYGVARDRLWVRESGKLSDDGRIFIFTSTPGECRLKTTGDYHPAAHSYKSVSSIHMPRWASRDTLEVVSARPERLHGITEEDAVAEGCERIQLDDGVQNRGTPQEFRGHPLTSTHISSFAMLWDSINGKTIPWAKNPWCWRVEFKRKTNEPECGQ